jgi:hypothetical protein
MTSILDADILKQMIEAVDGYRIKRLDVGDLADQLLTLRDILQFRDHHWEHELTQQIATLDSASTYTPEDQELAEQLTRAIKTANETIVRLVEEKLS